MEPKPRTPLPAYMILPSAAATTGSPTLPSISIPLVEALKPWMILPLAGQPQAIRAASLARGADTGVSVFTGVAGLTGEVCVPPLPAGRVLTAAIEVLPSRRKV